MVQRGSSELPGSWWQYCRRRRDGAALAHRQVADLLTVEHRCVPPLGAMDAGQRLAERRLAAAGLADDAERLARLHVE